MNPIILVYFLIHLKQCQSSKRSSLANTLLGSPKNSDDTQQTSIAEHGASASKVVYEDSFYTKAYKGEGNFEGVPLEDKRFEILLTASRETIGLFNDSSPIQQRDLDKGRPLPKLFVENHPPNKQNSQSKAPPIKDAIYLDLFLPAVAEIDGVNDPLSNLSHGSHLSDSYFRSTDFRNTSNSFSRTQDQNQYSARHQTRDISNIRNQNQPVISNASNYDPKTKYNRQNLLIPNQNIKVPRNRKKIWRSVDTSGPHAYSVYQHIGGTPNKSSVNLQKWLLFPNGIYSTKNNLISSKPNMNRPQVTPATNTPTVGPVTNSLNCSSFPNSQQRVQPFVSSEDYSDLLSSDEMENMEGDITSPFSSLDHNNGYQIQNKFFSTVDTIGNGTQHGVIAIFDSESQFSGIKKDTKVVPNLSRTGGRNQTLETFGKVNAALKFKNWVTADFLSNTIRNETVISTNANVTTETKTQTVVPKISVKKGAQFGVPQQFPLRPIQTSLNPIRVTQVQNPFTSMVRGVTNNLESIPFKNVFSHNNQKWKEIGHTIATPKLTPKSQFFPVTPHPLQFPYQTQLRPYGHFQNRTYEQYYPHNQHPLGQNVYFQQNQIPQAYYPGSQFNQHQMIQHGQNNLINSQLSPNKQYQQNQIRGPWTYNLQNPIISYQPNENTHLQELYHPVYQNQLFYPQPQFQNPYIAGPLLQNPLIYQQAHLSTFQVPQSSPNPSVILRVSSGPLSFQSQQSTDFRKPSKSKTSASERNPSKLEATSPATNETPKPSKTSGNTKKTPKPTKNPGNTNKTTKPTKKPANLKPPMNSKRPSKPAATSSNSNPIIKPAKEPVEPLKKPANLPQVLQPSPAHGGIYFDPWSNLLIPLRTKYSDSKTTVSRYGALPCSCVRKTLQCYCCVKLGLYLVDFHRTGE